MSGVSGFSWAQFLETFIDQFVQLFAFPGEDDPNSLDMYLFLWVPWQGKAGWHWSSSALDTQFLRKVCVQALMSPSIPDTFNGWTWVERDQAQGLICFCKKNNHPPFLTAYIFCPPFGHLLVQISESQSVVR